MTCENQKQLLKLNGACAHVCKSAPFRYDVIRDPKEAQTEAISTQKLSQSHNISNNLYTNIGTKVKKAQIKVWVSEEIANKLRQLIQLKHKKYRKGLLSEEVEEALRFWIALHTNAQISKELSSCLTPNPTPRVAMVFRQVKAYLLRNYYTQLPAGYQIPAKHLREAIAAVRGSDPRTIKKWMKAFADFHLIKHIAGELWEIAA